jgi:Flp pilus assembly CpaE family ATPase
MPMPPAMQHIVMLARELVVVLTPDVAGLRDTRAIRQLVTGLTGADRVITCSTASTCRESWKCR